MDILIIIPPYTLDGSGNGVVPIKAMLPVGPLSIAAALQDRDNTVQVVDATFTPDWRSLLTGHPFPDLLLVSCHTARNIGSVKAVLSYLDEQWDTLPHTVLGGNVCVELGIEAFHALNVPCDAVVRGYGHAPEVIDALLAHTPGDLLGRAEASLLLPAIELMDSATHAQYHELSADKYPMIGHGFGCAWKCSYCAAKMETRWQARIAQEVARELALAKFLGYSHIWCVDNLILVDSETTLRFDKLVEAKGMTWSAMTRPELIVHHPDELRELRALTNIAMGVESASPEQLKQVQRKTRTDPREAFRLLEEQTPGIERTAFAMLDWPDSTEEDFQALYHELRACRPTSVSWSFYNPTATDLLKGRKPEEYGFYHWPFGLSGLTPERVIQHAMILMGSWAKNCQWAPEPDPYFAEGNTFGVRFQEARIYQYESEQSPSGDIWTIWKQQRKRR